MYTEEELTQLEQDERQITDEAIALMILLLASLKSNLVDELRRFYSLYGKDGVVTYKEAKKWIGTNDHRKRLTALLFFINENFEAVKLELIPHFQKLLEDVVKKESEFFDTEVDTEKPLSQTWGSDDKNWLDRFDEDIALWTIYISNDIKQLIHRSETLDNVLAQLNKRFKNIEYVLGKLVITESTAIGSLARKEVFKALGVTKYRHFEVMDERTCEKCEPLHNCVFPISAYEIGVTASPLHSFCRGWEQPIFD